VSRVQEIYQQALELDNAEFEELFDLLSERFAAPEISEA